MEKNKDYVLSRIKEFIDSDISVMDTDSKVDVINKIKVMLHEVSPFNTEPVDCVVWVKNDTVRANDYNPNSVAPPEMELLRLSIANDGYTQPIVSMLDENKDGREVIDGFHRNRVGKECDDIQKRVHGYLPVVTIRDSQKGVNDRVASTIRHNRARGKHRVDSMSDIVVDLKKRNWSPSKIAKELGMDADEVLRLAQMSGLTELFKDKSFSKAWEVDYNEQN
jgi:ParB-like chromosome segregation protein Spo0J